MPKDKTTTRKTKAKGAADGGKKKKGKLMALLETMLFSS